ncbi:MAG: ATP synthase F0 subunit B [Bradymonadia bacterium]
MSFQSTPFKSASAVALLTLLSTPAIAGGDGEAGFTNVIFHAVNLVILLGLVIKYARSPIQKALKDQAAAVAADIDEARRLHDEAQKRLDDYDAKIKELDANKKQILEEYRQQGESEKANLIAEGKADADRLRQEAERTAAHELRQAKVKLETELVERAVDAATALISEKINAADRQRLTADYLTQLEEGIKG